MKVQTQRTIIRWIHIIFGSIIAIYVYSPWQSVTMFAFGVKAIVIPMLVLTGLWLWKGVR